MNFPPVDWISHSTDIYIYMGKAAQCSPPSIFMSSLLFSVKKYVLESSHLRDFYYNKIDCNILCELSVETHSLITVENDNMIKPQSMKILPEST